MTRKRPRGKPGLLAEEITRNERLQAFAQTLFDFGVDGRLAAASARAAGPAKLRMQPLAFTLDEGDDARENGCEIQPGLAPALPGTERRPASAGRRRRTLVEVAEVDPPFGQVVRRDF